jgi:hypothetical protein
MKYSLILVFTAAGIASACGSQKIKLAAAPGQESIVRDGVPALISSKQNVVMIKPNNQILKGNARPAFTVVVRNQGQKPVTLSEENITAI